MTAAVDARRAGGGRRTGGGRAVVLAVVLGALACLLAAQVVAAAPAAAHAELVDSTPANGERLDRAPREVVLRFTERVSVVQGAFRLLDADTGVEVDLGDPGDTGAEPADGSTVRFALPADLPEGSYLVTWRVVSADSHPIGGTSSFGVGADAPAAVAGPEDTGGAPVAVTVARGIGYAAFAAVAGSLALALLCWRQGRSDRRLRRLRSAGIVTGVAASVLALLLEGPYVAGVSTWRLFEPEVMEHVAHGQFGSWIHVRVLLYLLVGGVLWLPDALHEASNRWLAGLAVVGLAATFPGTGHAAAAGNLVEPVADGVHTLSAGVWVGGLLALAVSSVAGGARPGAEVFARFSRLALAAVLLLVGTGSLAAVLQLGSWDDLWTSRYGQLLSVKLVLVAAVVGVAVVARRTVGAGGSPWRPVRYEAVGTLAVLALTSALAVTAPPTRGAGDGTSGAGTGGVPVGGGDGAAAERTTVDFDLGDGRSARLEVEGLGTAGSRLRLTVPGPAQGPQSVRSASLRAELPAEGLAPTDVPLERTARGWRGDATFALPGEWQLTLTVERRDLTAVVAAGTVTVG